MLDTFKLFLYYLIQRTQINKQTKWNAFRLDFHLNQAFISLKLLYKITNQNDKNLATYITFLLISLFKNIYMVEFICI